MDLSVQDRRKDPAACFGHAKAIKPGRAREIAGELHAKVKLGGDPAAEKQEKVYRAGDTFGLLAARFLEQYHRRPEPNTRSAGILEKYSAPLHSAPVDAIGLRDIAGLLAQIAKAHGPVLANRVRATLSGCFSWGMREGLARSNPVFGSNKRAEQPRDRVLSNDELRRIWNAAGEDAYGTIVRLLTLTGQRRNEIGELRWPEIDLRLGL